eukprot:COSAG06_NODE_20039_length_811_cov_23.157303_1_plen_190_part_10
MLQVREKKRQGRPFVFFPFLRLMKTMVICQARLGTKHQSLQIETQKVPFLRYFILKINILPRQARDKHRETQNRMAGFFSLFRCRTTTRSVLSRTVTWWPGARRTGRTGTLRSKTTAGRRVRTRLRGKQQQRASCTRFASIYQDRLGTNIGKALKTSLNLPRQARDKHRKSTQNKTTHLLAGGNASITFG